MPYRNDLDALQDRLSQLQTRLDTVRAQKATAAAAAQEEPDLVRDMDRLRREVASRTRLPMLRDVQVAAPCNAPWDAMAGDDRVRFCGSCEKNVYNLSAMTSEQAEALLTEREGRLCVRYYRRADGTVLTADCPTGVRRRRVKIFAGVGVGLALATAGASLAFLHMGAPATRPPVVPTGWLSPTPVVQGGISRQPVITAPSVPPTVPGETTGEVAPVQGQPVMGGPRATPGPVHGVRAAPSPPMVMGHMARPQR